MRKVVLTTVIVFRLYLRKYTSNIYKFVLSLTDKPLFDKRLVFHNKLIHATFENTSRCVKCPGSPGVRECLVPDRDKIGPNTRTDNNVARGGMSPADSKLRDL